MKYLRILFLLVLFQNTLLAQIPAPRLVCVRRDTLIWTPPAIRCGTTNAYLIYAARNLGGPYQLLARVTNTTQTRYFFNNTEGGTWYFYLQTDASCAGLSRLSSDTLDNRPPALNPVLAVSVVNSTTVEVRWRRNTSPQTVGYIVYKRTLIGLSPIGTVTSRDTVRFLDTNASPNTRSEEYQVLAIDDCGNTSPFDANHKTMLLKVEQKKCEQSLVLKWNRYENWALPVASQQIWVSINGRNAFIEASVGANDTTYTIRNIDDRTRYRIFVRAVQATTGITSNSNDTTVVSDVIQPVTSLTLKNVSVNTKGNADLVWRWNINAKIDSVEILRRTEGGVFVTYAKFKPTYPIDDEAIFTDTSKLVTQKQVCYQIKTKDDCGARVTSNAFCSVFLSGTAMEGRKNDVSWTSFKNSNTFALGYQLVRSSNGITQNLGALLDTSRLTYTDLANPEEPIVCYRVGAKYSYTLPDNTTETAFSYSNTVCLSQSASLFMPNAFAPNGLNNAFKPILNFRGNVKTYKMQIFDRYGAKIWETTDPDTGWDGRRNNDDVPTGVYLFVVTVEQTNGKTLIEKGFVNLLR